MKIGSLVTGTRRTCQPPDPSTIACLLASLTTIVEHGGALITLEMACLARAADDNARRPSAGSRTRRSRATCKDRSVAQSRSPQQRHHGVVVVSGALSREQITRIDRASI